ncbi:MAG: hypothetical protein M1818_000491 [Claussenomyces sp. TS43310]|nr:MAG: hypothetical protein M1818_000491 [Claussenomyces sp. TS43310]
MDESEDISPDQDIDFCTMGMFIIDEIHFLPPKPPVFDIIGGGGTYSALGARLFSPPPLSKTVSWIVDQGSDFPPALKSLIKSWHTSCLLRTDTSRLTTRGWNDFDASETRAFRYSTPKLRIDAKSLTSSPLLRSKSFHLICNPTRCLELVRTITTARKSLLLPRPIFIWEPVPDRCVPSELLNTTRVLPYIDICSPNAVELGALLGYSISEVELSSGEVNPTFVEQATEQLLASMPLASFAIVVRAGKSGCYVAKNGGRTSRVSCFESAEVVRARDERAAEREAKKAKREREKLQTRPHKHMKTVTSNTEVTPTPKARPAHGHGGLTAETDMMALLAQLVAQRNEDHSDDDASSDTAQEEDEDGDDKEDPHYGISLWLPAYHTSSEKVVDPTGGGNAFLGGLAVGLAREHGLEAACRWGSVAASFAIEQVGAPVLDTADGENEEKWNGVSVQERLADYETRIGVGLEVIKIA